MRHTYNRWPVFAWATLILGASLLLAGCGSQTASTSAAPPSAASNSSANAPSAAGNAGVGAQPQQHAPFAANTPVAGATSGPSSGGGVQYLIKSLQVNMQVSDPRRAAAELQASITTTDLKATSAGMNIDQTDNGQYTVAMTFSVQASLYPQIQRYLADYAGQHGGKLTSLRESVQDVTNDYVDTQSRLANLRAEQQRLQTLMSKATSLTDVLTIEQRLTDVEGQIESIEAHLNALNGQVTFYSITLNLVPPSSAPATPSPSGWNPGQTLHDALLTALAFAEWLATIGIWVVVFSVFVVPALLITRLAVRYRARRLAPAAAVDAPRPA